MMSDNAVNVDFKKEGTEEVTEKVTENSKAQADEIAKVKKDLAIGQTAARLHHLEKVRKKMAKEKVNGIRTSTAKDDDYAQKTSDLLDERVAKFKSADEIDALTEEQLTEIFTDENGESIAIVYDNDKKRHVEFMRDYLKLIFTSNETMGNIDAQIEQFQKDMQEAKEDIDAIYAEFGDQNEVYKNNIKTLLEKETDPKKIKTYQKTLDAFEVIPVIQNMVQTVKGLKHPKNILGDYKDDERGNHVIKKFTKVKESLGVASNVIFTDFEKNFMDEKYKEYNNLFLFTVIRCIAYSYKPSKIYEGMFLINFATMMRNLATNQLEEEKKEQLIKVAEELNNAIID